MKTSLGILEAKFCKGGITVLASPCHPVQIGCNDLPGHEVESDLVRTSSEAAVCSAILNCKVMAPAVSGIVASLS